MRVSSTADDAAVPAPWLEPAQRQRAAGRRCGSATCPNWWKSAAAPRRKRWASLPVAVNGRIGKPNEEDAYELTVEPETEMQHRGRGRRARLADRRANWSCAIRKARASPSMTTIPTAPIRASPTKCRRTSPSIVAVVRDVNGNGGPRCIYRLLATAKGKRNAAGFTLDA